MKNEANCGPQSGCDKSNCPECERREEQIARQDEINLAVLIALVPMMTWSFFNMTGLL